MWPAVCVRGVVTLVAGPSKPLLGALYPPDLPSQSAPCPFDWGGSACVVCTGIEGGLGGSRGEGLRGGFLSLWSLFTLKINAIYLVVVES